MGYAKDVMTPNSNFSFASYPGTLSIVRPSSCIWSTCKPSAEHAYSPHPNANTYLEIRQRRVQTDTPIDEPVRAVDDPVLMEPAERLNDRLREVLVHRERDATPIIAASEPAQLVRNTVLVTITHHKLQMSRESTHE